MNEPKIPMGQRQSANALETDIRIAREKTTLVDRASDYFSEWFSSILVKEARQAIKSRQFLWTFFLLLLAVVVWTMVGLTINDTVSNDESTGPGLLTGYWFILGFPLLIIIPFGAYRSLAREFDEGTISLISISTMKCWHIVTGKMASIVLQMMIYLSILAPSIAFTYLLRGISISQIMLGLSLCVTTSICLCSMGLFMASSSRSSMFAVALSVFLVLGLAFVYYIWCVVATAIAFDTQDFMQSTRNEGQFLLFGYFGLIISSALLLLSSASVQISFEADNRSTMPRIMMLIQQTVFLAWCISFLTYFLHPRVLLFLIFISCHYWMIMGFVLVGESPHLSARVRRTVPRTLFGRSMFSLFIPGPGTGLIFALANLWICGMAIFVFGTHGESLLPPPQADTLMWLQGMRPQMKLTGLTVDKVMWSTVVACYYCTFFICSTYLFLLLTRKHQSGSVVGLLTGVVLVAACTLISMLLHFNLLPYGERDMYSFYQMGNWYWTTWAINESYWSTVEPEILGLCALVMAIPIVTALVHSTAEFLVCHQPAPERLRIEDEQLRRSRLKQREGESLDDIFGPLDEPANGEPSTAAVPMSEPSNRSITESE